MGVSNEAYNYAACFRYDVENPLKPGSPSSGTKFNITHDLRLTQNVLSSLFSNRHNKDNFYRYLCPRLVTLFSTTAKRFIITDREKTLGATAGDCNHLEADYRLVQFLYRLVAEGYTRVLVRTGDTDVIIIVTGHMKRLLEQNPSCQVTALFCSPTSVDYIDINKIANWVGLQYCMGFMLLYTFTGCDSTPSFSYHGKTKWLDFYLSDDECKGTFELLCRNPQSLNLDNLSRMVRFILKDYGVSSSAESDLLSARFEVLSRVTTKTFRCLPPSPGSCFVQMRKALYVAGLVWAKALELQIDYPAMEKWGWKKENDSVVPIWTVCLIPSPTLFKDCFRKCSKKCSCKACSCIKLGLKCLPDCGCRGECVQS